MRRTKAEAARTREAIVEAALACFDRYGIASSTLEQIAAKAGVTKGAIYHHFRGKRDIFREIREQVTMPVLDEADTELLRGGQAPALDRIEQFLVGVLETLEKDLRARCAVLVMSFKCEYVGDLADDLAAFVRNNDRLGKALEAAYREARDARQLARGVEPEIAALETLMVLSGLVRLWLAHGPRSAMRRRARAVIAAHVELRRAR